MKSSKFWALGLCSLLGAAFVSSDAKAANLYQDRQLVQEATVAARGWQFTVTDYKLRTVQVDISDLYPSSDKNRLELALQKAREAVAAYQISAYQKVQIIEDCGRIALESIDRLIAQGGGGGQVQGRLTRVIQLVRSSPELYQQGIYGGDPYGYRAANALREAQTTLNQYGYDSDLEQAEQSVRRSLDVLNDSYMNQQQKLSILRDSANRAVQSIQRSRAYRIELGGGNPYPNPQPPYPQPPYPVPHPPYPPVRQMVVQCSSIDHNYQSCYTGVVVQSLQVQRKISKASCNQGSSFGVGPDARSIWVSNGCRADFLVSY